jgi:murein DD-endopeptidase MepM/ murein hydrolase activator NlpD
MRTAGGLAVVGAGAGLVLAAVTVSWSLWLSPLPIDSAAARAGYAPRRAPEPAPAALAENSLEFPVLLLSSVRLQDSFRDPRAAGARTHHALDIMAPRHTPVRAVADGTIAKVSSGGAGGLALYQTDPSGAYCFYYAHLGAYAPGLSEGQPVRRGDVIGYVGTSGNAPESAPHLHFAVFQLRDRKRWWGGRAINPYPLLKLSANLTSDRPS